MNVTFTLGTTKTKASPDQEDSVLGGGPPPVAQSPQGYPPGSVHADIKTPGKKMERFRLAFNRLNQEKVGCQSKQSVSQSNQPTFSVLNLEIIWQKEFFFSFCQVQPGFKRGG